MPRQNASYDRNIFDNGNIDIRHLERSEISRRISLVSRGYIHNVDGCAAHGRIQSDGHQVQIHFHHKCGKTQEQGDKNGTHHTGQYANEQILGNCGENNSGNS